MTDLLAPREAAGSALRAFIRDIAPVVGGTGRNGAGTRIGPVSWHGLPEARRERWCEHADTVIDAVLAAFTGPVVDPVARELYRQHHEAANTMTEATMRHWDVGDQHVDKDPWRARARQVVAVLGDAYRTPPTTR